MFASTVQSTCTSVDPPCGRRVWSALPDTGSAAIVMSLRTVRDPSAAGAS